MPPKTAAERQRERRERLRASACNLDEYQQKDRERKRKRSEMCPEELQNMRKRGKVATRRWRVRKSTTVSGNISSSDLTSQNADNALPYKSPASFGKAKRRAENALPKSPRKRVAIVGKLAKDILKVKLPKAMRNSSTFKRSAELETAVKQYYFSDSISRVMSGKADVITIRNEDGSKQKLQKRHLVMTVGECYQTFKIDHPEHTIGLSKFASLRPKNCLLSSDMPHNVCGCKYHNNIILLLESLNRRFPEAVPLYSSDFINCCVCDATDENCMSDNCEACMDGKLFHVNITDKIAVAALNAEMSWFQWHQDEQYLSKVERHGKVQEALDGLTSQLPKFLWHVFIKRQQADSYEEHKTVAQAADSHCCLLQMDFAENYTVTYQDEIQSAHWRQRQITVYTVMLYHRNKVISRVIVTDCRDHQKRSVAAFTASVIDSVKCELKTVRNIVVWTDGPSSQYKNKFIFVLTAKLAEVYNLELSWNYFATSHGKGPNDALGGNVKRIAHQKVLSRQTVIHDAKSFERAVKTTDTSIEVITMSPDEIESKCKELDVDNLWSGVPSFRGSINTHCVIPEGDHIRCKFFTSSENFVMYSLPKTAKHG